MEKLSKEISNLKKAIDSWIEDNKNLIRESKCINEELTVRYKIAPINELASPAEIAMSKSVFIADLCAGKYFTVSDYKFSSTEFIIQFLDAIKTGNIEEKLLKVKNITVSTSGSIRLKGDVLYCGEHSIFHPLTKLISPTEEFLRYEHW